MAAYVVPMDSGLLVMAQLAGTPPKSNSSEERLAVPSRGSPRAEQELPTFGGEHLAPAAVPCGPQSTLTRIILIPEAGASQ